MGPHAQEEDDTDKLRRQEDHLCNGVGEDKYDKDAYPEKMFLFANICTVIANTAHLVFCS
jgi:hypothetical protein